MSFEDQHPDINRESQSFFPSEIVTLYELDARSLGADIFHFCSMTNDNKILQFQGVSYVPIEIETEGWEVSSGGTLPTPTVKISNVNKLIMAVAIAYKDLIGAKFKRIRTYRHFLDGENGQNPQATFIVDIFDIQQKTEASKYMIQWQLSASIDQEGKQLPGRQYLKEACTHIYRYYINGSFDYSRATCPYSGNNFFTKTGQVTTSPVEDDCGKLLTDCRLRFGENGNLPFSGFPGIGRFQQ